MGRVKLNCKTHSTFTMSYNILVTAEFSKEIKKLSKKYPSLKEEYYALLHSLLITPAQGTALGTSIYKIRPAIKSKTTGKRGGARVITYVRVSKEEILLVSIFDKAEQESVTIKEINQRIKSFYP